MSRSVSRRDFAKRVAALAILPATPSVVDAPAPAMPAPPAAHPSGPASPEVPSGPQQDAVALAQVVSNRWGDRLTAEELGEVLQNIDGGLRRAEELYRIPLANADAPDFVFTPYRGG